MDDRTVYGNNVDLISEEWRVEQIATSQLASGCFVTSFKKMPVEWMLSRSLASPSQLRRVHPEICKLVSGLATPKYNSEYVDFSQVVEPLIYLIILIL